MTDFILKALAAFTATPFPAICVALGTLVFFLLKHIGAMHKEYEEKILALTTTLIKHTERQGLVMEDTLRALELLPQKRKAPVAPQPKVLP